MTTRASYPADYEGQRIAENTTWFRTDPAEFTTKNPKRWAPAGSGKEVCNVDEPKVENFFTPSTQTSIRAIVPVIFPGAITCTGDPVVRLFMGVQTFNPGELGTGQGFVELTVKFTILACSVLS
jgi:hypothetical protein